MNNIVLYLVVCIMYIHVNKHKAVRDLTEAYVFFVSYLETTDLNRI